VLVVSHERSGTHLLIDLLRRNIPVCRARPALGRNPHDWLYFSLDRLNTGHRRAVPTAFADAALARAPRPLLKSHALPGFAGVRPDARAWLDDTLGRTTTLYVLRDGRAVMPSFHRHRMAMDPGTPLEFSRFLRTPIKGRTPPRAWAAHVNAWTARAGVQVVRFEEMTGEPAAALGRLAAILGETADPAVRDALPPRGASPWAARVARLTGRLKSSNLVEVGGRTPRWAEVFTGEDRAFFEGEAGETLAAFGYTEPSAETAVTTASGRDGLTPGVCRGA